MLVFLSSAMLPLTETSLTSTTVEITALRKTQSAWAGPSALLLLPLGSHSALRRTHHPNSGRCVTAGRHPRDSGGLFSRPSGPSPRLLQLTAQECPAEPSRVRYVVNGQTFSTSLSLGSSSSKVISKQWTKTREGKRHEATEDCQT